MLSHECNKGSRVPLLCFRCCNPIEVVFMKLCDLHYESETSSSFPALRWLPVPWLLLLLRNLLPGQPSLERSSDLVSLHMDQRSGCPPLTVLG
ncbi:hypothetical protein AMECASPLE_022961 [Ameca splendens]|uniref:Uncharacterized protein n=1 Tax=Ameca splendens TaxID=208324 RepID=A0ABV0YQW2_9TELE